jgi:CRP/FNR family transcriptional regulator
MFQSLLNHISRFVYLNDTEKQILTDHISLLHVNKKEYILSEGNICNANYFIIKGCFRMYFIKETGQEQIIQFGLDNWWITDYTSLESHQPSGFFIQAVEDSDIVVLTQADREIIFRQIPQMERYFRLLLQRMHAASLMRLQYLFDLSAEEIYHQFNARFPEFVQRVPQYMLASYLGFTPEVLSKIRRKK